MSDLIGNVIQRARGDTVPDVIVVIDQATGLPLASINTYQFTLTINSARNPTDDSTQKVQIVGTVIDAPAGKVQFAWDDAAADQTPGVYWYDIQQKDPGDKIKTIAKNKYVFVQDITKTT